MHREITEEAFMEIVKNPIQYMGIYELDWLLDVNLIDCEGVIIDFHDKRILVSAKEISEEYFDFAYFEVSKDYECRKIFTFQDEQFKYVMKDKVASNTLHFLIGKRPLIVVADYIEQVTVAISHWDSNGEWVDFENNNLLD